MAQSKTSKKLKKIDNRLGKETDKETIEILSRKKVKTGNTLQESNQKMKRSKKYGERKSKIQAQKKLLQGLKKPDKFIPHSERVKGNNKFVSSSTKAINISSYKNNEDEVWKTIDQKVNFDSLMVNSYQRKKNEEGTFSYRKVSRTSEEEFLINPKETIELLKKAYIKRVGQITNIVFK